MNTMVSRFWNKKRPTTNEIIFFEKYPFMSVELLSLLDNYKIACYYDEPIVRWLQKNWDVETFSNTSLTVEIESDKAVELMLADAQFMSQLTLKGGDPSGLFFFMSEDMDRLLGKAGIPLLLTPYSIQTKLGDKLNLSDICEQIGLISNQSLVFREKHPDFRRLFEECVSKLGLPLILQGSLGVSGEDTFVIDSINSFREHAEKLKGNFKATRYLRNNIPISVHVCLADHETIVRGPFLQLIGFPELSSKRFQFSGNDTNQTLFNDPLIETVRDMSFKIADYARANGYKGIFGIDFLWDRESNMVYVQELNTRFVGLTRLLTGMQKRHGIKPDIVRHIEAFATPSKFHKNISFIEERIDLPVGNYSQVIVHNNVQTPVTIARYLEPGIYKFQNSKLSKEKSSLFMEDMEEDEVLITYSAHKGTQLEPGGMISRIILARSIISSREYQIEKWAAVLIAQIKEYSIEGL